MVWLVVIVKRWALPRVTQCKVLSISIVAQFCTKLPFAQTLIAAHDNRH